VVSLSIIMKLKTYHHQLNSVLVSHESPYKTFKFELPPRATLLYVQICFCQIITLLFIHFIYDFLGVYYNSKRYPPFMCMDILNVQHMIK
jgi:hypothetical protein